MGESSVAMLVTLGQSARDERRRRNGHQTMGDYAEVIAKKGACWFSSLAHPMSKQWVTFFEQRIAAGEEVFLYVRISKAAGGTGNVEFQAKVVQVETSKDAIPCPDMKGPVPVFEDVGKIWLKLVHIERCNYPASDFVLATDSRKNLEGMGAKRYLFGYVIKHAS